MSEKAIMQRRVAPLKHGHFSKILQNLSNCHTCVLRHLCRKYNSLSDAEKNKGCHDVREVYYQNIKQYSNPELILIKTLAEIETQIQIQSLIDGKLNEGMSKDRMRLMYLKKDFLNMVFKYGKGTKQTIEIKNKDKEVFDMRGVNFRKIEENE